MCEIMWATFIFYPNKISTRKIVWATLIVHLKIYCWFLFDFVLFLVLESIFNALVDSLHEGLEENLGSWTHIISTSTVTLA
jgi:hypothetical protein